MFQVVLVNLSGSSSTDASVPSGTITVTVTSSVGCELVSTTV